MDFLRSTIIDFYNHWQSLVYLVFILLGALIATLVIHLFLRKRYNRLHRSEHNWRDTILGALNAPLQFVVWVIGFSIAASMLTVDGRMPLLAKMLPPVRDVAAIGIAAWFLIRLARQVSDNLHSHARAEGREFDETAADAIGKSVTAAIVVVAAL